MSASPTRFRSPASWSRGMRFSYGRTGKGCRFRKCWSNLATPSFPGRCWPASPRRRASRAAERPSPYKRLPLALSRPGPRSLERWRRPGPSPYSELPRRGRWSCWPKHRSRHSPASASNQTAKIAIVGAGELPGKVRIFSVAINPTTQLGQIRLFIGSDPKLRVGAFGRATIDVGRRCGPAIPLSAVLYGPGGAVVQVVRDNRIETRRVTVGLLCCRTGRDSRRPR